MSGTSLYSHPMRRFVALDIAAAALAACSSDEVRDATTEPPPVETVTTETDPADTVVDPSTSSTADAGPTTSAGQGTDPLSGRPFEVFVPTSYRADEPMPLVVLLHGFGASGIIQNLYFGMQPQAESRGFLYVHPDGTILEAVNRQFWNATDACCGFGSTVDDVAYLTALVEDVQSNYNVDPKRIFFVGHSNGGFMSYRMACDRADMVAAIVSLAGATWEDNSKCNPSEPVSVLQIHGTADGTIGFEGAKFLGNTHPGARETVATWAGNNGCTGPATELPTRLDIDASIPGDETTATKYGSCPATGAVELWVIPDAPHIPPLASTFAADIVDFLFAHPKA